MVNRAAPVGSMRYFALLYTPPELREAVTSLYVIDAEIRESAQSPNHDVAHTRLQWWRHEIDRLINNNAQHPAARILQSQDHFDRKRFAKLHELVVAADMDLARMTYLNERELRAYCARSGGVVQELIASLLVRDTQDEERVRSFAIRAGTGIREAEILRDLRQDAYEGRMYLPLDQFEAAQLKLEDLHSKQVGPALRKVLEAFAARVESELQLEGHDLPPAEKAYLRPLFVLAALHRQLVKRIARSNYDVASQRRELGPIEKPWIAWRAARQAG
ncbi:MAG: squalene/phytoene synthase family protein [Povalibacter sp.]|jgi:phytoene synthase